MLQVVEPVTESDLSSITGNEPGSTFPHMVRNHSTHSACYRTAEPRNGRALILAESAVKLRKDASYFDARTHWGSWILGISIIQKYEPGEIAYQEAAGSHICIKTERYTKGE